MNLTKELNSKSFVTMVDDHVSFDDVAENVISVYNAKEITEEYTIAILQQYTGQDYKSAKALMKRMDDYMNHPDHRPPTEDPGY
jgi:hypothetical protein